MVAAVASYVDARHHGGTWLVRIEDVDQTRVVPGAEQQILNTLLAFGMQWDERVVRQSERTALYDEALDSLIERGAVYRCNCSRKLIAAMARVGNEGPIYPGTCLRVPVPPGVAAAWRLRVTDAPVAIADRVLDSIVQNPAKEIGDFVVRRIDGFTAYQLAVVVDDQAQGVTDVVRGADLLWSTPRQVFLQHLLGFHTPRYAHMPVVYGDNGHKLSKRDHAHPLDDAHPLPALRAAWRWLGQIDAPDDITSPRAFWQWAVPRWNIGQVPQDRNNEHERPDSL